MRTLRLTVPSPVLQGRLDRWLAAQLHFLSRRQIEALIAAGQVRVGGSRVKRGEERLSSGQTVQIQWRPSLERRPDKLGVLARGAGWVAVDKPGGLPTHRSEEGGAGVPELLAPLLGLPVEAVQPVHRLDRFTSGVLLVAVDEQRRRELSSAFEQRAVRKEYRALVQPSPPGEDGALHHEGMDLRWKVRQRWGPRAELAVWPEQGRTHQIRIQLAAAGWPIVGDLEHGQPVPGGARRMGLHCWELGWDGERVQAPIAWGPMASEPKRARREASERGDASAEADRAPAGPSVKPARRKAARRQTLRVSAATARVLRSGHPWVVRDRDTGDLRGFRSGDVVDLIDPRGGPIAAAVVEPDRRICARVVRLRDDEEAGDEAWGSRVQAALLRRSSLLDDPATDALRLVHGPADDLPGVRVDLWGPAAVITRLTPAAAIYGPAITEVLAARWPGLGIWQLDHFEDLRQRGAPRSAERPGTWRVEPACGAVALGTRWDVRERGLTLAVEPLGGLTTGLYTDQRSNRDLVAGLLAEQPTTVLNLFGHTGAFSVAAAAAGSPSAVTVDLGRRFCDWTEANLRSNGFDPAVHRTFAADCLEWLESGEERFGGAILDPPGHARRRGRNRQDWNAVRDIASAVTAVGRRLEAGGWLLTSINVADAKPGWLRAQVRQGLEAAGHTIARLEAAPPASDHPTLKGFAEGRAFLGVLARLG